MLITKDDVGARVWSFSYGWGVIHSLKETNSPYPVIVDFKNENSLSFTFDGKAYEEDDRASIFWEEIKFTEPPKPKVKKKVKIEGWVNIYGADNTSKYVYESRQDAIRNCIVNGSIPVFMTGEYEVEE